MSREQQNKAIVARWFGATWGKDGDVSIVDELGAPDILVQYPMHGQLRGRDAVKAMLTEMRIAFPDLHFWAVGDLIAEGDYVVGRWDGGGTHTGPALTSLPVGRIGAGSGKKIRFTGTTVFRITNGKIAEEVGEEGALTALQQLGVIPAA
jgi:predicted ester cyclase